MPRTVKTPDEMDAEVMFGGPQMPPADTSQADTDPDDKPDDKGKKTLEEQLEEVRRENARLTGQVEALSRAPREPAPAPQPKPKAPERNWEKMLFEDTEKGVATLKQDIKDEITADLSQKYAADNGTKEFWRDFWEANPDLKKSEDGDIAEVVLNRNFQTLGDLPVSEAIKKLGDLTRERIMKYTGAKKKDPDPKGKAQVEAGGEKKPSAPPPQEAEIVSLSDLIRSRRANRAKALAKAQTA